MPTSPRSSTAVGALAALALLGAGCGDHVVADIDAGGDAGPELCTIPDTTCPLDQPLAGAACDTAMPCTYPDPGGTYTWTYACEGSAWAGTSSCDPTMVPPGGSCPVGPLVESCRPPFAGTISGATVEIGDPGAGPFRPLTTGERVSLITGGQGSPMLGFRVRVSGPSIPRCVSATTSMTVESNPSAVEMRSMALHCGTTLPAFQIVPDVCDGALHTLDIRVDIAGIGTTHVTVEYMGLPCYG